jgi:hypothetical protein
MFLYLERIDLENEILVLDERIDPLGQHTLQIALPRPTPCIGCHHPTDRRVGSQQTAKFSSRLELGREDALKHGEEKVLLARLVLVPIQGEHDGLKECVDFGEGDEATEGRDMPWFGLEKEEEVRILLRSYFSNQ